MSRVAWGFGAEKYRDFIDRRDSGNASEISNLSDANGTLLPSGLLGPVGLRI